MLFGNNGNSYTVCTQSDMCIYTYILHSIETLVGQKKLKKKLGQQGMPRAKDIFQRAISDTRVRGSHSVTNSVLSTRSVPRTTYTL